MIVTAGTSNSVTLGERNTQAMLRVLSTNGDLLECPAAVSGRVVGNDLLLLDSDGNIVFRHPNALTLAFGANPSLERTARLLRELMLHESRIAARISRRTAMLEAEGYP